MGSLLLNIIISQLNQYIRSVSKANSSGTIDDSVVFDNIATSEFAGGANANLGERVVMSLVNVAEESSLKNNIADYQINQQHFQLNPIVHVNLYLLFTANFDNYGQAVDKLFRVMEFFQGRRIFKFKNAPISAVDADELERLGEIELMAELHTLSFEQLNDLWGSLGGKQMPFVLYRLRSIPIQMQQITSRGGVITEIDIALESDA